MRLLILAAAAAAVAAATVAWTVGHGRRESGPRAIDARSLNPGQTDDDVQPWDVRTLTATTDVGWQRSAVTGLSGERRA